MDALGRDIEGAQLLLSETHGSINSNDGKSILRASNAAILNYPEYSEGLRAFGDQIRAKVATAPAPSLKQDDFDIQEASPEDYTSNTVLTASENLFSQNITQEDQLDKTFVIGGEAGAPTLVQVPKQVVEPTPELRSSLDNLSFAGIDKVANGASIEEAKEEKEEQITKVEEKAKQLVLTNDKNGRKAAYIDTVILCLIAQLSIFGLLIIVLLIIK